MSNKDAVKPNAQQQQVIDTVDGAVLVVAGAGTGKTATVVKRKAAGGFERIFERVRQSPAPTPQRKKDLP